MLFWLSLFIVLRLGGIQILYPSNAPCSCQAFGQEAFVASGSPEAVTSPGAEAASDSAVPLDFRCLHDSIITLHFGRLIMVIVMGGLRMQEAQSAVMLPSGSLTLKASMPASIAKLSGSKLCGARCSCTTISLLAVLLVRLCQSSVSYSAGTIEWTVTVGLPGRNRTCNKVLN
jgi:hypothetical protein